MKEPTVFIGSSSESKEIAEYIQVALDEHFETTIWDQDVFKLTANTLQILVEATKKFDFAVLICSSDDSVRRRETELKVPRDNVILEAGLFMGAMGLNRTFLVICRDDKVTLPSDFAGVSYATFRHRNDGNIRAAINPAAVSIRQAIRKLGPRIDTIQVQESSSKLRSIIDIANLTDILTSLALGFSGISVAIEDDRKYMGWAKSVIGMALAHFSTRQTDVYAVWLRPASQPHILEPFLSKNFPESDSHYFFGLGEGLVGTVWKEGISATTSRMNQHKWWVFREGCENSTYICSCVGHAADNGGVFAIGSDNGFDVQEEDEGIVKMYAAALAIGHYKNGKS